MHRNRVVGKTTLFIFYGGKNMNELSQLILDADIASTLYVTYNEAVLFQGKTIPTIGSLIYVYRAQCEELNSLVLLLESARVVVSEEETKKMRDLFDKMSNLREEEVFYLLKVFRYIFYDYDNVIVNQPQKGCW